MANKYLDYGGVQTLWNAIKDRDNVMSSKKAGYIHYDESEKVIQLWASESDFTAYNEALTQAAEVDRDICDTTDLDAALAVDVSACTKLEQAKAELIHSRVNDEVKSLIQMLESYLDEHEEI